MNLETKYTIACAHMYGVVPIKIISELYNEQTNNIFNINNVSEEILSKHFIKHIGAFIVGPAYNSNFDVLEDYSKKKSMHYYIPDQEELLNYVQDSYIEETPVVKEIRAFYRQFDMTEEWVEDYLTDMFYTAQYMSDIDEILDRLEKQGYILTDKHADKLLDLFLQLRSTQRSDDQNRFNFSEIEEIEDIYRNDKCFCGSGIKYKKCCIDKTLRDKENEDEFIRILTQEDDFFEY